MGITLAPHAFPQPYTRLRRVMRETGLNRSQLAEAAGATKATMTRYFTDGKRGMAAEHGFNLAKSTGFDAQWLLLGVGDPLGRDGDLPHPYAVIVRHLRVVIATVSQLAGESK
ncbi:MAG: helix-turn-helix transcriptional regulator [Gammaproteobacteria bacterium]